MVKKRVQNKRNATIIALMACCAIATGCNDDIIDPGHHWSFIDPGTDPVTCTNCSHGDCINGVCIPHSVCTPECDPDKGEVCFHSACVQISTTCDPACGDDTVCINGECLPLDGCRPECKADEVCINGACIDPWRICADDGNQKCQGEQFCVAGLDNTCAPSGNICSQTCASGRVCFNGACVLESSDCESECADSQVCINGVCVKPGVCQTECRNGKACINGVCHDPQFCSPACTSPSVCTAGRCVDPSLCNPECNAEESCFNLVCVDTSNTCNPACTDPDVCINNVCATPSTDSCNPECGEHEKCINGICVAPKRECVEKGEKCADGEFCTVYGEDAECRTPGSHCHEACEGDNVCFNGTCITPGTDCNESGEVTESGKCNQGTVCIHGNCEEPGVCNPACDGGKICINGRCEDPNFCSPECPKGQECIQGVCSSIDGCSPACENGELCFQGTCIQPKPDECSCDDPKAICVNKVCVVPNVCIPECAENQVCVNSVCKDIKPKCETGDPTTSDNATQGCDEMQICVSTPKGATPDACFDPGNLCVPSCQPGQKCFNGICVNPNDGGCESDQCKVTEICINGDCETPGVCSEACPENQICLNGTCTDPNYCSPECAKDQTCIQGRCVPSGTDTCDPACEPTEVCVNGKCEPKPADCDPACEPTEVCVNGKCEPGCNPACEPTEVCVSGKCEPKPVDCDPACKADEVCVNGKCTDPDDVCDPACKADEQCVYNTCIPKDDSCQPACDAEKGEVCINGVCVTTDCNPACSDRQMCVGGVCIDPKPVCTPICTGEMVCAYDDCRQVPGQVCTPRCNDRTQICYNNQCVPRTDCDPACNAANGELCINGECINPGSCDPACQPGTVCVNNRCIDPNFCAPECQSPQVCLEGACVDPSVIDPDKQCNPTCKNGTICKDGSCVPACTDGLIYYNGECKDPTEICRPECAPGFTCIDNVCRLQCDDPSKLCGYYDGSELMSLPEGLTPEDVAQKCCTADQVCLFPLCVDKKQIEKPCEGDDCKTCTTDADCSEEQFCSDGNCVDKCKKNSDCELDEACDLATGYCINPDDVADVCAPTKREFSDELPISLKWNWPNCLADDGKTGIPSKHRSFLRVIMTPLVTRLIDTNNDGKIDAHDTPIVAFISYDMNRSPDNQAPSVIRLLKPVEKNVGGKVKYLCEEVASSEPLYFTYPSDLGIADVDNDGVPEIVSGTNRHNTVVKLDGQDELQVLHLVKEGANYTLKTKYALNINDAKHANDAKVIFPSFAYLDANDKYPSIITNIGVAMIDDTGGTKTLKWRTGCEEHTSWGMVHAIDLIGDGKEKQLITNTTIYDKNCQPLLENMPGGNYIAIADMLPDSQNAVADGELTPEIVHVINGKLAADDTSFDKTKPNIGSLKITKLYKKGSTWSYKTQLHAPLPVDENRDQYKNTYKCGEGLKNGCTPGGGNPVIADFDGDGMPDIGVASRYYYVVYKPYQCTEGACKICNGKGCILWADGTTVDYSSASTGSSVFDFDGDGRAEVVYSDERTLHVYIGTGDPGTTTDSNGYKVKKVLIEKPNFSATGAEYPIIADIDNDGATEIVVSSDCTDHVNTQGNYDGCAVPGLLKTHLDAGGTVEDFPRGTMGINVYHDPNNGWVRSRTIWNQHPYHITNINEDGTVPKEDVPHWDLKALQGFSPWEMPDGKIAKYNNYRQNTQPSGLANAPDFLPGALTVNDANCPTYVHLNARLINRGTLGTSHASVVRFYVKDGDADKLIGIVPVAMSLPAGSHTTIKYTWIDGNILNTDGTPSGETFDITTGGADIYYTVDFDNQIGECDESNNTSKLFHLDAQCRLN